MTSANTSDTTSTPDANANSTGESVTVSDTRPLPADTLPLTEAAQQLGLTLPRLQRILKRPEFAAHVHTGQRQTKTGTRTVTLVSVSILADIGRWATEQKREQYGQNHYRSALAEAQQDGAQLVPAEKLELLAAVVRTKDAEIAEKDRHLHTKDSLIAEKDERIMLLTEKIAGLEQRLARTPLPEAANSAQGAAEAGAAAKQVADALVPSEAPTEAKVTEPKVGGWWSRLWRRGSEQANE